MIIRLPSWIVFARLWICLFFCVPVFAASSPSAHPISLRSPDGKIQFIFRLTDSLPVYSVLFQGRVLIGASPLELEFSGAPAFGHGLKTGRPVLTEGEDDYRLIVGKTAHVQDRYREVRIPLEEEALPHRHVDFVVRVFNDGLAFRYVFAAQSGRAGFELTAEHTSFRLQGDPVMMASYRVNYNTSHEGRYIRRPFSRQIADSLMDMPVFLEWPEHIYATITEARLRDYAGMYLVKRGDRLQSELSPLPESGKEPPAGLLSAAEQRVRVKGTMPHVSPWRVMLIGSRAGALIESNIITSLNDSCAFGDLSWLKPGTTDFHWWNGDIVPDTTFPPGINFETNQYYIDFCARHHIAYHSVIGYGGVAWYTNDGISYDAGPHADVTKPIPSLDMQKICDYARQKGVGIRVWVHWKALYPMLDKAFTQFEQWGISGMMVDFMDRDDQEMVRIQEEILQKAAAHHLHIQFHGAFKPTGLSRTYPNEFTREGTLNYENDKWGDPITPDDDLNVVFTRLLAGPTDYHLGGFRAVRPGQYRPHYTRPLVLGTRSHMLAMYIVLESYLGMICDDPAAYEGQPGFEFLPSVPTTWDETRAITAIPGEYVTIARRKGMAWYIGTINNHQQRDASFKLDWLPPGEYTATIYRDAPDAGIDPNKLVIETRTIRSGEVLSLQLAAGGGQAMVIVPKRD